MVNYYLITDERKVTFEDIIRKYGYKGLTKKLLEQFYDEYID